MGIFDRVLGRFFGHGREVRLAKKAELRGELAQAAELYGLAGAPEEAARVMLLRGDAERDPRARMQHYVQALALAPEGGETKKLARKKRAELVIAQFPSGATSPQVKADLLGAAKDLELAGENARAAEVYRRVGDTEGQARALAQSGDVEELETLLSGEQEKDRASRRRGEAHANVEMLIDCGKRREALEEAEKWVATAPDDRTMQDRVAQLRSKRVQGPVVELWALGAPLTVVLGAEVTIGRTDGTLIAPSHAVSRTHLRLSRENGKPVVRDLGSRNGTQLRGMNVVGSLPVDAMLELTLGKEVRVALSPSGVFEGAVQIELGGSVYIAPLGPAHVPGSALRVEEGEGRWVELVAPPDSPAILGETACAERTTVLRGDVFKTTRGGAPVLKVMGA